MGNRYDATYDELYAIELLKGSFLPDVDEFVKSESPDWISRDSRIGIEVTRVQCKREGMLNALWNKNVGKERKEIHPKELDAIKHNSFFYDGKLAGYGTINDIPELRELAVETYKKKERKLNSCFTILDSNRLFMYISAALDDGDINRIAWSILERRDPKNRRFDIVYILNDDQFYLVELKDFDVAVAKRILSETAMREIKVIANNKREIKEWKNGDIYK